MGTEALGKPFDILTAIASGTPIIRDGDTIIRVSSYFPIGTAPGFIDVSIATPGEEPPVQFIVTQDNRGHRWGDEEHSEVVAQAVTQQALNALGHTR